MLLCACVCVCVCVWGRDFLTPDESESVRLSVLVGAALIQQKNAAHTTHVGIAASIHSAELCDGVGARSSAKHYFDPLGAVVATRQVHADREGGHKQGQTRF